MDLGTLVVPLDLNIPPVTYVLFEKLLSHFCLDSGSLQACSSSSKLFCAVVMCFYILKEQITIRPDEFLKLMSFFVKKTYLKEIYVQ